MQPSILVISSSYPYGASEIFLTSELNALAEGGARVVVAPLWPRGPLSIPTNLSPRVMVSRLSHSRGRMNTAVLRALRTPATKAGSRSRRDTVRDAVSASLGSAVASLIKREQIDILHGYWATGPATACAAAAGKIRVPWTFTAHSFDIPGNSSLVEKARASNGVRFISQFGLNRSGLESARTRVIHLGVDIPELDQLSPMQASRIEIACPANLNEAKGHRYLIAAMRLLVDWGHDVRLTAFGDGAERSRLEEHARSLDLDGRIRFEGFVRHDDLLSRYRRGLFNLVVLPSIELNGRSEGIPVSLMEAMAHRLPVVSTSIGGIPELVPSGLELLVPPSDSNALAAAIALVFESPERYEFVAQSCREAVKEGFDIREQGALFSRFVQECH